MEKAPGFVLELRFLVPLLVGTGGGDFKGPSERNFPLFSALSPAPFPSEKIQTNTHFIRIEEPGVNSLYRNLHLISEILIEEIKARAEP